jgi:molecular chaperone GrpE
MICFEHDDCCKHTSNEQGHDCVSEAASQVTVCEQELMACKEKLAKAEERYIYLNADFENFRRNVTKERAQWAQMAQNRIFEGLVVIVDDLSRAVEDFNRLTDISESEKARFNGVELVYKNFLRFLQQHEVTEITTQGLFNPHMHEALMQVDVEGKQSGEIVAVLQKGYMHKDVVIRPAKVSVAC